MSKHSFFFLPHNQVYGKVNFNFPKILYRSFFHGSKYSQLTNGTNENILVENRIRKKRSYSYFTRLPIYIHEWNKSNDCSISQVKDINIRKRTFHLSKGIRNRDEPERENKHKEEKTFFEKLEEQQRIHQAQATIPFANDEESSSNSSPQTIVSPNSDSTTNRSHTPTAIEMNQDLLKELSEMGPLTKVPRLSSKLQQDDNDTLSVDASEGKVMPTKSEIEKVLKNRRGLYSSDDIGGFTVEEIHYLLCSYKDEGYKFDPEVLEKVKEHHKIESVQEILNILEYVREPYNFEKDGVTYALWSQSEKDVMNF